MNNNDTNLFNGFFFGALLGAGIAYFYSQNKDMVDNKIKTALNDTQKMASDKLNEAKESTSDMLKDSGNGITSFGEKLANTIEEKANQAGDKADEMSKNIRKNR